MGVRLNAHEQWAAFGLSQTETYVFHALWAAPMLLMHGVAFSHRRTGFSEKQVASDLGDGEVAGVTEADPEAMAEAQLVIEDVPLGEHIFEWFLRNKRTEWRDYKTHVSQFEVDRYMRSL